MENWVHGFPGSVMVCDTDLTVVYMNEAAERNYAREGGRALVGTSIAGCHRQSSIDTVKGILDSGVPNMYTVEKQGVRKFVCQAPWMDGDRIAGIVELSIELPRDMPHRVRTP